MSLESLSQEFLELFSNDKYAEAVVLLPRIKLEFAKVGLLDPSAAFSHEDLMAARQLLEMGVLALIHAGGDSEEIYRLIAQLRPFYSPQLKLEQSENASKLTALHLLLLLATNDTTEFHSELETLPESFEQDQYIQYPVRLERWLMEGAYDRAWHAVTEQSQFPAPEFAILTQSLQSTIRNEIALCSEQAYTVLPLANARHLLFFNSDAEFIDFAKTRDWTVSAGKVTFPTEQAPEEQGDNLIQNLLGYATHIETIV